MILINQAENQGNGDIEASDTTLYYLAYLRVHVSICIYTHTRILREIIAQGS